jgi:hypothetical protein
MAVVDHYCGDNSLRMGSIRGVISVSGRHNAWSDSIFLGFMGNEDGAGLSRQSEQLRSKYVLNSRSKQRLVSRRNQ